MTDFAHVEGPWVRASVSLVIEKAELDPGAITEALGIEATTTRLPGPSRWRPADDTNGLWILECDQGMAKGVDEQLHHVLSRIEPDSEALTNLLRSGHQVSVEIRGYAGDGAVLEIAPALLARIMALGISLEVIPNINER
ncbi:DUF4279 domain-containing protein [Streptomyces sp. ET3-23]|uniref:DUF4279 domain-containing protein n=1 Tax=Streptomyces sp. ET3-23 TaxID=2885643 RepID=UPI001D1142F2|nr:DUF4279 domain-containing protein [Streptomyces sp. ET3-23]MCC2278573.1 DUF4279 domain-containing protein [Streptomyces sp. ET3-23]